ncbi:MAG: glycosyltransferase [Oscillospiraceae bacterium]|nr:glycosyltransferase [Oscillospiraceae bacterium]
MISVIVPVYNAEKYLPKCIESILAQTYRELELILVNDGSTDGSGHICDAYQKKDHRVIVIHAENGGVSKARNIGMAHATAEYIAFVDADDYILQTMYEKLHSAITDKDIAFCRFAHIYPDRTILYEETNLKQLVKRPFDPKYVMVDRYSRDEGNRIVCDKVYGCIWRQLFVRRIIEENGIRFKEGVKIAEDRLFLLEYLNHCNTAALVDEYLYQYRMENPNSATAVFHKYRADLVQSQKKLINYQNNLLDRNLRLSRKERICLRDFIEYKAIMAVVLNEIKYNTAESVRNLRLVFKDPLFSKGMSLRCLKNMKCQYGESLKTVALGLMIKFRMWSLIRRILS